MHFTCNSDPALLSGKTYDNLYLDVKGCGENINISNLNITGSLIYNGDNDYTDHNVAISNSKIQHILFPCENTHQCRLNIDYQCQINEISAMPTGKDGGKIFLSGNISSDKSLISYTYRLNLITSELTEDIKNSYKAPDSVPESYSYIYSSGNSDAEIELKEINVIELSVVNTNKNIYPSISMRSHVRVCLLAAYTPKLKIYNQDKNEVDESVFAMITSVDGSDFELSIDSVSLYNFHFLGNNNADSVLILKNGYEKLHGTDFLKNIFIFGGNMNFMGYTAPSRSIPTLRRLIYTLQPEEYKLEPSLCIMNDLLNNYYEIDANATEEGRQLMYPFEENIYYYRLMMGLTQEFAKDWPEIEIDWKPYVKLSYVNIMYANVVDSIREKVPQLNMFLIQNDSFMTGSREVTRYGWSDLLDQYSNNLIKINPMSSIWDQVGEGCYTFEI